MEYPGFDLKPRSRPGADHRGKPSVYFTGYPADIERYFDEVSDDILKAQNCVIYRDPCPTVPRGQAELERMIGEMRMLVIPVTGDFLTRGSRARDEEFPIAWRLHKPVLFWAQTDLTPEQIQLFNEKCRKLQMLVKQEQTPQPLPYGTKLAAFLSENLVGDHLAERVRAAFDAYIFLSYRKKDRGHVKPLMQAIHQNDFCRDIAIWYDEFLTIGESFSTAIEQAMQKSSLVTLLVTPNILEPGNYVKENEYRDACRLPRPVLPILAEETDPNALEREFDGLPNCITLDDPHALAQALHDAFGTGKLDTLPETDRPRVPKGTPEHDYLIGLAYLHGIDLETDSTRGCALITRAAEQGYDEAVEQLAQMYHNGNGVERNGRTAIAWQERLVELRRRENEASPTEENGLQLARACFHLGELCYELRDLPAAKRAYREMLEAGEKLIAAFGPERVAHMLAVARIMLGDICQDEGDLAQAREYFEDCWKMCWDVNQREDTGAVMYFSLVKCIDCCLGRLGRLCEMTGDLAGAADFYQRELTLTKALAEAEPGEDTKHNLAVGYENLGNTALTEGRLDQAEEYYGQSLRIFQEIADEYQTEHAKESLATSFTKMGDACKAKGDLERARDCYLQSLALRDRPEALTSAQGRTRLAISCNLVGLAFYRLGELPQARAYTERAQELNRRLLEEVETLEALHGLSISCSRLGDISMDEGNMAGAERWYLEDLQLSRQLAERVPSIINQRNLALSYNRLGMLYYKRQDLERTRQCHLRSAELYRQAAEQLDVPEVWHQLASEYYALGLVSTGSQREAYAMQAYDIWKRLLRADPGNSEYLECRDTVLSALL